MREGVTITAAPTCGKSTLVKELREMCINVVDTDELIEEWLAGKDWSAWHDLEPSTKRAYELVILRRARSRGDIVLTNLHTPDAREFFTRKKEDIRYYFLRDGKRTNFEWLKGDGILKNRYFSESNTHVLERHDFLTLDKIQKYIGL